MPRKKGVRSSSRLQTFQFFHKCVPVSNAYINRSIDRRSHFSNISSVREPLRPRCVYELRWISKRVASSSSSSFFFVPCRHEVLVARRVLRLDCPARAERRHRDRQRRAALPPLALVPPPRPGLPRNADWAFSSSHATRNKTHLSLPVVLYTLHRTPADTPARC